MAVLAADASPLRIEPAGSPRLDPTVLAAGIDQLRSTDAALSELIDAVGPCTLTLQDDLFFALVHAIISQQISTRAKTTIVERVRALYAPAPFPTPERLLATPDDRLRAAGCSSAKVSYLKDLSTRIVSGTLDLDRLPGLPDEAVIGALVGAKGIGRWTAEMFLIFSLGRLDVWPVDDLGVVVGTQRLLNLQERPKPKQLRVIGERWRPYRTLVSWYLWRMPREMIRNDP